MKKFQGLGRVLSKNEQMNIKGGCPITELCEDDPSGGGDTCCNSTSDCPDKDGKSKSCSTHYSCGDNQHKCFWVTVS